MDAYEIAVLAEDYSNKRAIRDALAMHNSAGLSAEERRASAVAYHVADANCIEAWGKLEKAPLMPGDLPITVELWDDAEQHIEEVLARAGNAIIGRAAFEAAVKLSPNSRILLCDRARIIDRYPK